MDSGLEETSITSRLRQGYSGQGRSRSDLELEMVGADFHAAIEIKAMGGETLDAGIESKIVALFFFCVFDQPIEKGSAESAGAVGVMRDQIVDVEGATGEKEIENAEAGDGANGAIELEIIELISYSLSLENPRVAIDRLS